MNELKVAFVWNISDIRETLIFNLLKKISKKNIIEAKPNKVDLIIYGRYNWDERLFQIYKQLKKRIKSIAFHNFIEKIQLKPVSINFNNRCLIFLTNKFILHGYKKIAIDKYRATLNFNYYTKKNFSHSPSSHKTL